MKLPPEPIVMRLWNPHRQFATRLVTSLPVMLTIATDEEPGYFPGRLETMAALANNGWQFTKLGLASLRTDDDDNMPNDMGGVGCEC